MAEIKMAVRRVYQALLPHRFRAKIREVPIVSAAFRILVDGDTRFHDEAYGERFFASERRPWLEQSAPVFAEGLMRHCSPSSVIDVGCGEGAYLASCANGGMEAHGVELAEAGLRRCREAGLDVKKFDITKENHLPWSADAVYSIEVAEHLLPRYADHFVELLAESARQWVVITAAKPGQAGINHFNCQPKSYWIEKFNRFGFCYKENVTEAWQEANREQGLPHWLYENLIVLRKEADHA